MPPRTRAMTRSHKSVEQGRATHAASASSSELESELDRFGHPLDSIKIEKTLSNPHSGWGFAYSVASLVLRTVEGSVGLTK